MSAHIEWLAARFTVVEGTAEPGLFVSDESENGAAAIRITTEDGIGIIIEGRPETLVEKAKEILRAAEQTLVDTMRSPELRRLYGITRQDDLAHEAATRDLKDVSDEEYTDLVNGRTTLGELGVAP